MTPPYELDVVIDALLQPEGVSKEAGGAPSRDSERTRSLKAALLELLKIERSRAEEAKAAMAGEITDARDAEKLKASLEKTRVENEKIQELILAEQRKATDAEANASALRSGKFLEYGITAGMAAMVNASLGLSEDWEVTTEAAASGMPYIALVPAYWGGAYEQNKYCASVWSASATEAQLAADAFARKRARVVVDEIVGRFQVTETDEANTAHLKPYLKTKDDGTLDEDRNTPLLNALRQHARATRLRDLVSAAADLDGDLARFLSKHWMDTTKEQLASAEAQLLGWVLTNTIDWDPGIQASCAARKFGVYVGYPLDSAWGVRESSDATPSDVDATGIVSIGAVFLPNAYVSVLAGFTLTTLSLSNGVDKAFWQFSLGLGGNLDLVMLIQEL